MPSKNRYRLCWYALSNDHLSISFAKTGEKGDCYIDAVTEAHDLSRYRGIMGMTTRSFTEPMDIDEIQEFAQKPEQLRGFRGRGIQDILGIQISDQSDRHVLFDPPVEVRS